MQTHPFYFVQPLEKVKKPFALIGKKLLEEDIIRCRVDVVNCYVKACLGCTVWLIFDEVFASDSADLI